MKTRYTLIVAVLLIAAWPHANAEDATEEGYVTEFVYGNLAFILLHEIAHVIIEDFDVPVLGNNEDAADTLAAMFLIRLDRLSPDFRYIRMLVAAADGQRILWQRGAEQENPILYLANHPLSVQRAARMVCLAYGSEPELLEPLPEIFGLPEFRAFWCEEEFEAAEQAWSWVRDTYILQSAGGAGGHQVKYVPTSDPDFQPIRDRLVEGRVLERVLEVVEEGKLASQNEAPLYLREDATLIAKSCDEPNAYWDGNERELVVCYELIQALYGLSADEQLREVFDQIKELQRDR